MCFYPVVAILFNHGIGIVKQKHELLLGCFYHWTILIFLQLPVVAGVVCIKHVNIHITQQRNRFICAVAYQGILFGGGVNKFS